MANVPNSGDFSKEEIVRLVERVARYEASNMYLAMTKKYEGVLPSTLVETNQVIWEYVPGVGIVYALPNPSAGYDIDANNWNGQTTGPGTQNTSLFSQRSLLSIPMKLDTQLGSGFIITDGQLLNKRYFDQSFNNNMDRVMAEINNRIRLFIATVGTMAVYRPSTLYGYDDVVIADNMATERGVSMSSGMKLILTPSSYSTMAANLAISSVGKITTAGDDSGITGRALRNNMLGRVAGFDTIRGDNAVRATGYWNLASGANTYPVLSSGTTVQYYKPVATSAGGPTGFTTSGAPGILNVDNRVQVITVDKLSAGSGTTATKVVAGMCVTFGLRSVNIMSKAPGELALTHRITAVGPATGPAVLQNSLVGLPVLLGPNQIQISPPIITAQTTGRNTGDLIVNVSEQQYQNCMGTLAVNTPMQILDTAANGVFNPFFMSDSFNILPGSFVVDGVYGSYVYMVTESGIPVRIVKFFDINTASLKYRIDVLFGLNVFDNTTMGVMVGSQPGTPSLIVTN